MIAGRDYPYREFCDYARRFSRVGLLNMPVASFRLS